MLAKDLYDRQHLAGWAPASNYAAFRHRATTWRLGGRTRKIHVITRTAELAGSFEPAPGLFAGEFRAETSERGTKSF
jgi:hypothetical protein